MSKIKAMLENGDEVTLFARYGVQYQFGRDVSSDTWNWLSGNYKTREEAEAEAQRLLAKGEREDRMQRRETVDAGNGIGVETKYYSEYTTVAARVVKRFLTNWEKVEA